MHLSIVGCPDKKQFLPYVKRATKFYAEELLSERRLRDIYIRIKFSKKLEVYGYASVEDNTGTKKPKEFLIEVHSKIGAADILKTIAHEMVHIKQYACGELDETLMSWKGKRVDSDSLDYYDHPWEVEAHGLEVSLFSKFAIKEKLWDVFEGINNPDGPIKTTEIKWKKIS
jgi:hypothetical protein